MIGVDQTTFGFPGGNCFSACVASLLELPIADVPYFMVGDEWYEEQLTPWLAERGFYPLMFQLRRTRWRPPGLCIMGGKSPREPENPDALHSVVARGPELVIVHDPHPSRAGLLRQDDVIVLVPMDPIGGAA